MFKRVLLCYDGSEDSRRALKRGADLAILVSAQVHVLSVIPSAVDAAVAVAQSAGCNVTADSDGFYSKILAESIEWLKARGVTAQGYLARGNTTDVIVAYAKRLDVDLIVLGHYPNAPGGRWWSGGQRGSLAERAQCCVLVAVAADDAPSAEPAR